MPWKETGRVFERTRFIENYLSGCFTIAELAARYGVSRRTLYKWLGRHDAAGLDGLHDRSRTPRQRPHQTHQTIEAQLVEFRRRFPFMGPKKIVARLSELHPDVSWPAASTVGDILLRHGLVQRRVRRRPPVHPIGARLKPGAPNDLMTIDFKGQFRLGNRRYCYPLTIVDAYSRYLLACDALISNDFHSTRRVFERVFRTYGLPGSILSDNGSPFASPGLARMSRLSMWWIRLGIGVQRIAPGRPDQNGAHERMHKTLKEETTRPPGRDHLGQQKISDRFRREYNDERPHEALGQRRPATLYTPSLRPYPNKLPPIEYPGYYETRRVDRTGLVRWHDERVFISHTLEGEVIGFEEIDDGIWSVYYGPMLLARFDERERKFHS